MGYAERLKNNQAIETMAGTGPQLNGAMLSANGQTGEFSYIGIGKKFDEAVEIKSVSLVVDFAMTRIKYRHGSDMTVTSNYVVAGQKTPYSITIGGVTYVGQTKKELSGKMQLKDGESLSQETIYIGYPATIDGEAQATAEPIWYVSRGINAWRMNDTLNEAGGLTAATLLTITNNRSKFKNASGGMNFVLDYSAQQIDESRIQSMGDWIDASGAADVVEKYKNDMIAESNRISQPQFEQTGMSTNDLFGSTDVPEIKDDDLPF